MALLPGWRKSFNPRPRREGDLSVGDTVIVARDVSIHALAGRATSCIGIRPYTSYCFNPRPRREGDHNIYRV